MSGTDIAFSDQFELQKPLSDDDAYEMLSRWHAAATKLGFGFFAGRAVAIQTGNATLSHLKRNALTLDTQGSRLVIVLDGARFQFGNLGFLTPDFRAVYDVDGLSLILSNNDWVLLFEDRGEFDASLLERQFEYLR